MVASKVCRLVRMNSAVLHFQVTVAIFYISEFNLKGYVASGLAVLHFQVTVAIFYISEFNLKGYVASGLAFSVVRWPWKTESIRAKRFASPAKVHVRRNTNRTLPSCIDLDARDRTTPALTNFACRQVCFGVSIGSGV